MLQTRLIGRTISVTLAEIVELSLSCGVGIGVIVSILKGSGEFFVCGEVNGASGFVQVRLKPVCSVTCQEGGCIGDFCTVIRVSGWVRREDQGDPSCKLGELGTSSVQIVWFIQLWDTRGRGSAGR